MLSLLLPSTTRLIATRKGRPMNTNVFRLLLLGSLFSLSACVQQSEVRQMKHSVSTLNQEMTQLNKETVKITQQNRLNAKSSSGVYLLPGAKTPARLESQLLIVRMPDFISGIFYHFFLFIIAFKSANGLYFASPTSFCASSPAITVVPY